MHYSRDVIMPLLRPHTKNINWQRSSVIYSFLRNHADRLEPSVMRSADARRVDGGRFSLNLFFLYQRWRHALVASVAA